MNIETRYLIRWGVPGWILIMTITLYFVIRYPDMLAAIGDKAPSVLAAGAILTVIGIPIGYLLNQMHHVWIWVIRVDWYKYFDMELEITEKFYEDKNNGDNQNLELMDRYRYLLTRMHELGSTFVALMASILFILINSIINNFTGSIILYLVILCVITVNVLFSRNYYRKNLDAFTMKYVKKDYNSLRNKGFKWLNNKSKLFDWFNV